VHDNHLQIRCRRLGCALHALYLVVGVAMGLYMAASHDHTLRPAHAHLNLLGWVSLALFGLFYRAVPAAAENRLAKLHFWVYVPAHLVQMVLLTLFYSGYPAVEPALALFSIAVGVGVLIFAANVWKNTGAK
jgi:cbb3-type cytochrome oxidase subunit 1